MINEAEFKAFLNEFALYAQDNDAGVFVLHT